MRGKRFKEEQIIGVLKEAEAGVGVQELCRKYGMSDGTFYNWKAKYGGLALESPLGQPARIVRLPREKVTNPDSSRADIRDLVARDIDVRTAHVHLDAVVTDVLNAAAGDDSSFGVVKQQRAGHLDSGL
jgi:transposase-like protein